ncbi:Fic family protein [Desulfoluna sp.]|uniref:Fic family protein n=1 Tax=Desulfoluna sp. TaxID=2045199 RepID=UPI002618B6D7|nr:Fic family protein [Desulfoluna sp.]
MVISDTYSNMTPNKRMAKYLAIREVPSLVYEAVNLEGVLMTLPEVQTILDGVTVGGHKISDQTMVINQAKTWGRLFELIDEDHFDFTKPVALELHNIAGREEAFEWGVFRSGNVSISGSDYEPPSADQLDKIWLKTESEIELATDVYDKAISAFLNMARAQFFWDVNKRMGRFMMNGILLNEGYPIINVPVKRQLEFNEYMLEFYSSNDMKNMNQFLRSCINEKIIANFK